MRETDEGTVLINCFGGCGAGEIAAAAGLTLSDLFPRRAPDPRIPYRHPKPLRFNAGELLALAVTEGLICALACRAMRSTKGLWDADIHRLGIAEHALLRVYAEVQS